MKPYQGRYKPKSEVRNNSDDLNQQLVFDNWVIEHVGNAGWIETTIQAVKGALNGTDLPNPVPDINFSVTPVRDQKPQRR